MKSGTRPYRMGARADAVAATRERILDAAVAAFWDDPAGLAPLEDVARRAGTTVPTLLRHFGSKDGLLDAAVQREAGRVQAHRDPATVRTPAEAVTQLVDHYEDLGDQVLRLLAEEGRHPAVHDIAETGRRFHRTWCAHVFARSLEGLPSAARRRRLAQLVAVCDVYTWKLLRRDSGLSRAQVELAILELLEPLLVPAPSSEEY